MGRKALAEYGQCREEKKIYQWSECINARASDNPEDQLHLCDEMMHRIMQSTQGGKGIRSIS